MIITDKNNYTDPAQVVRHMLSMTAAAKYIKRKESARKNKFFRKVKKC